MSWISKLLEKKVIDEVSKQLNLEITKDGKVELKSGKQCQFCKATMPKTEDFCPKCHRCLK